MDFFSFLKLNGERWYEKVDMKGSFEQTASTPIWPMVQGYVLMMSTLVSHIFIRLSCNPEKRTTMYIKVYVMKWTFSRILSIHILYRITPNSSRQLISLYIKEISACKAPINICIYSSKLIRNFIPHPCPYTKPLVILFKSLHLPLSCRVDS